jgi:hypothetical protein
VTDASPISRDVKKGQPVCLIMEGQPIGFGVDETSVHVFAIVPFQFPEAG